MYLGGGGGRDRFRKLIDICENKRCFNKRDLMDYLGFYSSSDEDHSERLKDYLTKYNSLEGNRSFY